MHKISSFIEKKHNCLNSKLISQASHFYIQQRFERATKHSLNNITVLRLSKTQTRAKIIFEIIAFDRHLCFFLHRLGTPYM